jgi:hypothetical protein
MRILTSGTGVAGPTLAYWLARYGMLEYVMYPEVGQEVSRFSMRNDRTMFLFTMADPDRTMPGDPGRGSAVHPRRNQGPRWIAHLTADRGFSDRFALPDYS